MGFEVAEISGSVLCVQILQEIRFSLVGTGGFLTRIILTKEKQPFRLQKQKGRGGGIKMEETEQTWTATVHFQMENIEANQKDAAATDDLDRSEYEKPTDTWDLVQEMHATGCLTGHKAKSPQVDTYK